MDIPHNHLLARMTPDEYARMSPHMELVPMPLGAVYVESGCKLQHVYFPTTAIVALHYLLENGSSMETASIGNEGMLGICLLMRGDTSPSRASVRAGGFGYRMRVQPLMEEFNRGESLHHLLLRYLQAMMIQTSQIAVCNRHHALEQQLCSWLLRTLDRTPSNELIVTQEMIANMLGVRREGVTEAAGELQRAGLIRYRRGHITVLDRGGLEEHSCECYGVVKTELDRLIGRNRESGLRTGNFMSQPKVNWHISLPA